MSLIQTLIARDSAGRLKTLTDTEFPNPYFNGGTPMSQLNELVARFTAPTNKQFVGGIAYEGVNGAILGNVANPIANYVNGMPVDAAGTVCAEANGVVALFKDGLPFTAAGRICTAPSAIINLHGFTTGFSQTGFR